MSYPLRHFLHFVPIVLVAPAAAAQAPGLSVLSIPERQPISCSTVQPKQGMLQGSGIMNRRFQIGQAEHIGGDPATPIVAPRNVELMTDAVGGVFLLDRAQRGDGAEIVSVRVAPKGRPGLWRTITLDRAKIEERIAGGDFTSRPREEGSVTSRALTSTEEAKADSLAQWLLKRGCTP